MTAGLVGASAAALILGLFWFLDGVIPQAVHNREGVSTEISTGPLGRLAKRARLLSARQRIVLAVAFIAGLVAFAITGWVVMLALVPIAVLGLPALLRAPRNHELELLQDLDRWVRGLATSLPTGKSMTDAIRSTRRQAPARLSEPVTVMVARLDARWSTADALHSMADELDSPDSDAIIAALILASERGGMGASQTLEALSDSIQERLRARREIEAERSKPRVVVQQITLITAVVLGIALVVGGDFFDPYRTATGQLILAALIAAYVGSLVMLRRMTLPRRRERILVHAGTR